MFITWRAFLLKCEQVNLCHIFLTRKNKSDGQTQLIYQSFCFNTVKDSFGPEVSGGFLEITALQFEATSGLTMQRKEVVERSVSFNITMA